MAKEEKGVEVIEKKEVVAETMNPQSLIEQGIKNGSSIEVMERMFNLQERWEKNQAKKAFDFAMSKFQADCPVIKKNKQVLDKTGKLRYSFASIDSIVTQTKKLISDCGLSFRFKNKVTETEMIVKCVVTHVDGHSEESPFTVNLGTEQYMTDTQKSGARSTFAKRYAFCDAFGIMTGDEDNDAVEPSNKPADDAEVEKMLKKLSDCTKDAQVVALWDNFSKEVKADIQIIKKTGEMRNLISKAV